MTYNSKKTVRQFSPASPSMMDKWIEQKAKLIRKFPQLANYDLRYKEGKKNEMLNGIRIKLGISTEEWKKILE